MPIGKACSQACHASRNVAILAAQIDPELLRLYQGPDFIGTQIILRAKNADALVLAHEKAKAEGLITSLSIDRDHIMLPHFDGSPIITALGIGPCTQDQARKITRPFRLME